MYNSFNADDNFFVGFGTRMRLRKLLDEGDLSHAQSTKFFKSACAFYIRAMKYALENFSLKDELIKNAKLVNIPSRESATISQVAYFVTR